MEQIQAAEEYALSKLCVEIPSTFKAGLTQWDDTIKACKITQAGCSAEDPTNPLSYLGFSSSGEFLYPSTSNPMFGEFWEKWVPEHLVMKTTKKSPTKMVCSRANHLLYQWCEYPSTRARGVEPGVTNVPKFNYAVRNGVETCTITKQYCDNKGISFTSTPGKEDCYVSEGQKVGEFFASDVLVRKINASDIRLKKNIKLYRKDWIAPGIDAYTYEWNDIATELYGLKGFDIGFIADKLDPKYVYVDNFGYKRINLNVETPEMQKIRAFVYLKQELLKNI